MGLTAQSQTQLPAICTNWCLATVKEQEIAPGLKSRRVCCRDSDSGTHGPWKCQPRRRGNGPASCQPPGFFQEDSRLIKPQRSEDMNHIQKIVFLHLSACELIIYERMIFLEFKLFGFTTAIKCLAVLLKASRSYWNPVINKQTNIWSVSLSAIFQQNQ